MEIPLLHITAGVRGGLRDGFRTTIYGLCEEGWMWAYDTKHDKWDRISNPRTGAGKSEPTDPGEHTPSWREL